MKHIGNTTEKPEEDAHPAGPKEPSQSMGHVLERKFYGSGRKNKGGGVCLSVKSHPLYVIDRKRPPRCPNAGSVNN